MNKTPEDIAREFANAFILSQADKEYVELAITGYEIQLHSLQADMDAAMSALEGLIIGIENCKDMSQLKRLREQVK